MDLDNIRALVADQKANQKNEVNKLRALIQAIRSGEIFSQLGAQLPSSPEDAIKQAFADTVSFAVPGVKSWANYAKGRGITRDTGVSEAFDRGGVVAAIPVAVARAALAMGRELEPALMGKPEYRNGRAPSSSTPNDTELGQVSSAPASSPKARGDVHSAVAEFRRGGGKGVIRVTGSGGDSDFQYDSTTPDKTVSKVSWTAPQLEERLTKERVEVLNTKLKAEADAKARVLQAALGSGLDAETLTKRIPAMRYFLGGE